VVIFFYAPLKSLSASGGGVRGIILKTKKTSTREFSFS